MHEWEYTNDEICKFLSTLNMNEQAETNDLDELFPPLDGTAMYAMACKMNHSCDPNVAALYFNTTQPLVAHCVALRDIDEGEKLCISYIASNESLSEWQEALANYGFPCSCTKCLRQAAELESNELNTTQECQEEITSDLFGSDDNDDSGEKGSNTTEEDGETAL